MYFYSGERKNTQAKSCNSAPLIYAGPIRCLKQVQAQLSLSIKGKNSATLFCQ